LTRVVGGDDIYRDRPLLPLDMHEEKTSLDQLELTDEFLRGVGHSVADEC
jgi:hypothetical protein